MSAGAGHPVVQLAAILAKRDTALPGSTGGSACDLEGLDTAGQQALLSIQVRATNCSRAGRLSCSCPGQAFESLCLFRSAGIA